MSRTRPTRVLIIVQNLPVPLDRRVWLECQALTAAGYQVSVICPKGPGDPARQPARGGAPQRGEAILEGARDRAHLGAVEAVDEPVQRAEERERRGEHGERTPRGHGIPRLTDRPTCAAKRL